MKVYIHMVCSKVFIHMVCSKVFTHMACSKVFIHMDGQLLLEQPNAVVDSEGVQGYWSLQLVEPGCI